MNDCSCALAAEWCIFYELPADLVSRHKAAKENSGLNNARI